MNPKALLIHADGTVEELTQDEACGKTLFREEKCKTCGHATGPVRKYAGHFASNRLTVPSHKLAALHREPANMGTIVFIEEPA